MSFQELIFGFGIKWYNFKKIIERQKYKKATKQFKHSSEAGFYCHDRNNTFNRHSGTHSKENCAVFEEK